MLFNSTKLGQAAYILASGALGEVGINTFTPPTGSEIETFIHTLVQVVVGLVTIYATVRKMFQKPETVVKLPVDVVLPTVPVAAATPVTERPAATPSDLADGLR